MRTGNLSALDEREKNNKIANDPDFLRAPNYGNSLLKVRQAHPEGVPDKDIAKYLSLSIDEIKAIHQAALEKLREYLR